MNKKIMLLGVAVVSALAFAALPAVAAAATPEEDFTNAKFKNITTASASLTTVNNGAVTCAGANSASGEFTTKTTGKISLTFTNCKQGIVNCQNGATGEIKVGPLEFHLVYIKEDVNGTAATKTPGVLITPGATQFVEFKCSFVTVKVTGNGVIGHIESGCQANAGKTFAVNFASNSAGVQTYQTTTEAGPFSLKAFGESASQDGTAELEFEGGGTAQLTCP